MTPEHDDAIWDTRGPCDGPIDCVGTERGCAVCSPDPAYEYDAPCCTCDCIACNPNAGRRPDTRHERGGHHTGTGGGR
jgi:hypothetical protein